MGVDYIIEGICPGDSEVYKRMYAIKVACDAALIGYPPEVKKFFGVEDENVSEKGIIVDLDKFVEAGMDRHKQPVWDVDIRNLPPEVKIVRFRISC